MFKKIISFLLVLILNLFLFVIDTQAYSDSTDTDNDGISDYEEINIYHTNPKMIDTDEDSYSDGVEIVNGYSPWHLDGKKLVDVDSDEDGLNDAWEIKLGTNLVNTDSDSDGYLDGIEILHGYDPLSSLTIKIKKKIEVSLDTQVLSYYFGDKNLETFKISSGVSSMPTPKGEFTILKKVPSRDYGGNGFSFYHPDTKWNLHFTSKRWRYYIHGAYWHNDFGQPASTGCVNVSYANMERLYNFAEIGTKINIF